MSRSSSAPTILVVDNHDSFVFTLVGYLEQLGATVTVVEADEIADPDAALAGFDGVMISPGPGTPAAAGASIDVVRAAARATVPLIGVCLGHQAIAEAFGARVGRAPEPMHGRTSALRHDGTGLFAGVAPDVLVGRYHSLAVEPASLPHDLVVTADSDGVIMALAHRTAPVVGVQFHPESVLTTGGYRMLANWLDGISPSGAVTRAATLSPLSARRSTSP